MAGFDATLIYLPLLQKPCPYPHLFTITHHYRAFANTFTTGNGLIFRA